MAFQGHKINFPNEITPPLDGVILGDVAEPDLLRRTPNPVGPLAYRQPGPRGFESHRLRRLPSHNTNQAFALGGGT